MASAAHEIRLELEQGPAYLTFREGDDLEQIADAFAAKHGLQGGEGCVGRDCVVRMLTSAMRTSAMQTSMRRHACGTQHSM